MAGVVHRMEGLHDLGYIQRARWSAVGTFAARGPADLVVVGRPAPGTDAVAVIAGLKDDPATAEIPVLHAATEEPGCVECRADVCLSGGSTPGQLGRVARVLLELGEARSRAEPTSRTLAARSERLEALGRLTGGIVHDFNNLLFVITGHVELARRQLPAGHPAVARLVPVLHAADRASGLARQLLAFGRGPGGRPRLADVNAVVSDLDRMLQRVIGEDVVVETRLGTGLGRVRADSGDIEQLLLNLALNARDAMPRGGSLTIETRDVEIAGGSAPPVPPGRYLMLAVSDDGVGMDAETRRRMFEPFFTTKAQGEGWGLGLASVHGIVERCSGSLRVDSERGRGTTIRVYLPCVSEAADGSRGEAGPVDPPGGHETVLVVEDSAPVREVACALLEGLGYTVLAAAGAEEALALARSHPGPIDLLLTDVVMPGVRGGSLAQQLAASRREARVLFMSGYGDAVARGPGGPGAGDPILTKPFDEGRLARAVREVLGRDRGRPATS